MITLYATVVGKGGAAPARRTHCGYGTNGVPGQALDTSLNAFVVEINPIVNDITGVTSAVMPWQLNIVYADVRGVALLPPDRTGYDCQSQA